MSLFKADLCFGVDISFDYFDVDLLLDALQIGSEIKRSKRIVQLVKEHGKRHRIIQIAKRQMALDIVKTALDKGVMPYDSYFHEKTTLSSVADRLYDAEERLLQICLSIALGKSVKGLRKLGDGYGTKELRVLSNQGRSLFRYFRSLLNDHTRSVILSFKEEAADDGKDKKEVASRSAASDLKNETLPESQIEELPKKKTEIKSRIKPTEFIDEVVRANLLLLEGQDLLTEQVKNMKVGAPFDVTALQKYCNQLIRSYDRNPFALLALRHAKESESYLLQHLLSSAVLGVHFARVIGLSDSYVSAIALGGLLFDIGRFRLPDALSSKSSKLTQIESDLFRKHIDFALSAVKNSDGLVKLIYQMISDHHERIDGTGYPVGKQDDEISIYGKMAAIIDAYDAMTSEQQHKVSMGPVKACERLIKEAGLAFDKKLVEKFVQSMGEYPVGSCVSLSNGRIGFVISLNKLNQPSLIRQVFSVAQNAFIPVVDISVDSSSSKRSDVKIVSEVNPQLHGIQFINHLF
ncbi:HD-GYP domain-containing protein [Marinomonas sp. 2405UD68-3]|uniref:HD-GYP domain-containing protein n=1 Tax=Marinomonas sp. 2405UD68-3 TaxID=3391835 RepID=UPI0039C8DFCF